MAQVRRNFKEAEKFCKRWDGHLASITSEKESAQLQALFDANRKTPFWMGGIKKMGQNKFTWTDMEPF